jgi:hypothetical protein
VALAFHRAHSACLNLSGSRRINHFLELVMTEFFYKQDIDGKIAFRFDLDAVSAVVDPDL